MRAAKDMAPEFLGHLHNDAPCRWKHSSEGSAAEPRGSIGIWTDARLTWFAESALAVIKKVPVSAGAMRDIFDKRLESQGRRTCLAERGHGWRRRPRLGVDALALVVEAQEDVLGADVVVVEHPGFFLSQDDDPAGAVGKSLEHSLVTCSPSPGCSGRHRAPELPL